MPVGGLDRQSLAESTMLAPSSGGLAVIVTKEFHGFNICKSLVVHNNDLLYTCHSQHE